MSVVEKERVTEKQDHDTPRMRHIGIPDGEDKTPVALCGYRLPVIPNYDKEKDRGPARTADCIVCLELYVYWGGVL